MINNVNIHLKMDCFDFLSQLPKNYFKIAFADFQYRGVLDKMKYGNSEKQKARTDLPQMSEQYISDCISEIVDVLKPSGYLFLWVDKFHLLNLNKILGHLYPKYSVVDMITYNKKTFGMGYRTRCTSEFIVIVQKLPKNAKTSWTDRSIRDIQEEKIEKKDKIHPHQKPIGIITRLIKATCQRGDFVLDPCAGSFVVGRACDDLGINFVGNDIIYGDDTFTIGETNHILTR